MKESMMPSAEELEKIQRENLTEEQIAKDKEREDAYKAGMEQGKSEAKKPKSKIEKMAEKFKLSEKVKGYFEDGLVEYKSGLYGPGLLEPKAGITKEQLLEVIKELPLIWHFELCSARKSNRISEEIVDELLKHKELKSVCASDLNNRNNPNSLSRAEEKLYEKLNSAVSQRESA